VPGYEASVFYVSRPKGMRNESRSDLEQGFKTSPLLIPKFRTLADSRRLATPMTPESSQADVRREENWAKVRQPANLCD